VQSLRLSQSSCARQELSALVALSASRHTHVAPLLDVLQTSRYLHLMMPLFEGGDLFARVAEAAEQGGLSQSEARGYFRDVVTGLLELKACGIAHGCVCPSPRAAVPVVVVCACEEVLVSVCVGASLCVPVFAVPMCMCTL
jgi:hypothetical protein